MKKLPIKSYTTIDLARLVKWEAVRRALEYYYPHTQMKGTKRVLEMIQAYKPKKSSGELLHIETQLALCLSHGEKAEDISYHTSTDKFSLSFRPWRDVCSIEINPTTLQHFQASEIVAHVIWEITWYGNEKQMMDERKNLFSKVAKFSKEHKEGHSLKIKKK